ncbi:tripartite tricarboxylate transporter permease [Nanoarchaeota archaeon]
MLLHFIIAISLGVFFGIGTGLTPGVHINLVSLVLLSLSVFFLQYTSPVVLCVFIIAMAITHTFLDSIPGIYLGAPNEAQALIILPGHRMLLEGQGHNAVKLMTIGSFFALLFGLLFVPLFIFLISRIYDLFRAWTGWALILIITYMVLKEHNWEKRLNSLLVFLMAGCLGLITLNLPMEQPLLPLLSGLFGFSLLLISLLDQNKIPEQKTDQQLDIDRATFFKSTLAATFVGFIAAFLPGFGSSQAAIVAMQFLRKMNEYGFLILVGGINTANMMLSIITSYVIDKARNGAIVAIKSIIGIVTFEIMILFLLTALLCAGSGVVLALRISRIFAKYIVKVNYAAIVISIMAFVFILSVYFDGFLGFMVLFTSTSIGLFTSGLGVGKNHLMGCLILPVILFFVL